MADSKTPELSQTIVNSDTTSLTKKKETESQKTSQEKATKKTQFVSLLPFPKIPNSNSHNKIAQIRFLFHKFSEKQKRRLEFLNG